MNTKRDVLMVGVALVAGLVGGVVSRWVLLGPPVSTQQTSEQAKVIQAERFEVVDEDGKVRAGLGIGKNGDPALGLLDKDGKVRAWLTLSDEGPSLWLYDKDEKRRAAFKLIQGVPSMGLFDKDGKTRAGLVLADGEPHLLLADENEKPRVYLSLFQGEPTLELSDKDGKTRAALGYTDLKNKRTGSVEKRSASSLVLFGEDGKVIWQAP